MKVKPQENIKGEFIENSSAYLLNYSLDSFEQEIAFICKALKESVDNERYESLPDISEPLVP